MNVRISPNILQKINDRKISRLEVEQCFQNVEFGYLEDTRAEHLTDPITRWFVAETDKGRTLKIMFVPEKDGVSLKSAYEAKPDVIRIYQKYATK